MGEDVHKVGAVTQITIVKLKLVRSWLLVVVSLRDNGRI